MSTTTESHSSTMQDEALKRQTLKRMDFNWCVRLRDVWHDQPFDIPDSHQDLHHLFKERLQQMPKSRAADDGLGMVFVGPGGVGKTHLLSNFRRQTLAADATFVLVDMTDVHQFWDTVLQGYMDSLQEPLDDGSTQLLNSLKRFIDFITTNNSAEQTLNHLLTGSPSKVKKICKQILGFLSRKDRAAVRHQDAIRAICCLNSEDFDLQTIGHTWLQSQPLEDEDMRLLGFKFRQQTPHQIVESISWYLSLSGPTVVAFDQLDPIVSQMRIEAAGKSDPLAQTATELIVHQISAGLSDMRELFRTLPLLTCVETSWQQLSEQTMHTLMDRFASPINVAHRDVDGFAQQMIRPRAKAAAEGTGFALPHPTWPFTPEALEELNNESPRRILKKCDAKCRELISRPSVGEVTTFREEKTGGNGKEVAPVGAAELDVRFKHFREAADLTRLSNYRIEDETQAPLCEVALDILRREVAASLPQNVSVNIDRRFPGRTNSRPLHCRLRMEFHDEDEREQHYCVRFLDWENAVAFQNRLNSAMTSSGIAPSLKFRTLTILRTTELPGGTKTEALLRLFAQAGGIIHELSDSELRTLSALQQMLEEDDPEFEQWLASRKPLSTWHPELAKSLVLDIPTPGEHQPAPKKRPSDQDVVDEATSPPPRLSDGNDDVSPGNSEEVKEAGAPNPISGAAAGEDKPVPDPALPEPEPVAKPGTLQLGTKLKSFVNDSVAEIPLINLSRHTLIMGGSGAGKTVCVRRLVEEATLAGIPSIIIDCGKDMCTFDEKRGVPSEFWRDGDQARADRLADITDFRVYTPGRESGRNLVLEPIPDLTVLRADQDELNDAVAMIDAALSQIATHGNSQKGKHQRGILSHSLKWFARNMPETNLDSFVDLLEALPDEAMLGIPKEEQLAVDMASNLKVAIAKDPLLGCSGTPIDPNILFGDDGSVPEGRTRISAISLIGLQDLSAQQSFINQLSMLMFSWIKKNPHPPNNRELRGLLVVDEARDFFPSGKASVCKDSMTRLAAQARKYKLGLVLATQNPKDLDNKIIGNCATQFFGKLSSQTALATANQMLSEQGVSNPKLPKMNKGQFWVSSPDSELSKPAHLQMPDSLTQARLLDEDDIMAKATSD